jgi:hypothetical protein
MEHLKKLNLPLLVVCSFIFGIFPPGKIYAQGRYHLTERDGQVISELPANALVTGPTNQTIILNDRGNRKVFEVIWDADGGAVVIKGDQLHLKIHRSGKIEKWTDLDDDKKDPFPIFIQPVVPVNPPR